MPTRLENVVVASAAPPALARFWAALLDWRISLEDDDEVDVRAPAEDGWELDLIFVPVPDPKTVQNRLHFDLSSASPDQQVATVERALSLGASRIDIGQRNVPWVVMADPEGNEFCVRESHPLYQDTGAVGAIVYDAADPGGLADFWSEASGWPIVSRATEVVALRAPSGRGPYLEFGLTPQPKQVKDRVHLDVRPFAQEDQAAEVARLTGLGAHPADVGQGDEVSWVVLADPEDNEFCVLRPG